VLTADIWRCTKFPLGLCWCLFWHKLTRRLRVSSYLAAAAGTRASLIGEWPGLDSTLLQPACQS
jgi:hypothetical protein